MQPTQIAKQVLNFQKTAVDSGFDVMIMMQDQMEAMSNKVLSQLPFIPDSGKEMVNSWVKAFKNGRDAVKSNIDSGFQRAEDFVGAFDKTEAPKAKGKAKAS